MGQGQIKADFEIGVQASVSLSDSDVQISAEEREKINARRAMIMKEIVETERNYVKAMREVVEKWETPLRAALAEKEVLSVKEIQVIFSIADGKILN